MIIRLQPDAAYIYIATLFHLFFTSISI
jgi:hypothetical protein